MFRREICSCAETQAQSLNSTNNIIIQVKRAFQQRMQKSPPAGKFCDISLKVTEAYVYIAPQLRESGPAMRRSLLPAEGEGLSGKIIPPYKLYSEKVRKMPGLEIMRERIWTAGEI
jgi:hypothetical protein